MNTNYYPPKNFRFPSTRYSGSKRRLLPWIWQNTKDLEFQSVLDLFGGTASVSLLFKYHGKEVHFNDILLSNQLTGIALIQNSTCTVTDDEFETIISDIDDIDAPSFIANQFEGIFFTQEENIWLDKMITRLSYVEPYEKRAILMVSLFQACLSKRPYNLFHRANLYMRLADVERSFGNKTTWETPFPILMKRYLEEYNAAVFSNQMRNRVVGGCDAFSAPNDADLVYLDPPYLAAGKATGTNYLDYYHFLEGLADYSSWKSRIEDDRKTKGFRDLPAMNDFIRADKIYESFESVFNRFRDSIIVLSYRDDGIPARDELVEMLAGLGKEVTVHKKPYRYALSPNPKYELLFIAQ